MQLQLMSLEDTEKLAIQLAETLVPGDIVCLTGDLGAGKTTFTQKLVQVLGVQEPVTSPTFTIVNTYDAPVTVHHFDVYRIADSEELYDIGFEEYIFSESISIIEWANRIKDLLPQEAIWLHLYFDDKGQRTVSWETNNEQVKERLKGCFAC